MQTLKIGILFIFLVTIFVPTITTLAITKEDCMNARQCNTKTGTEKNDCTNACEKEAVEKQTAAKLDNPLGPKADNLAVIYGRVIYAFLGLSGAVALIMFIIGGFTWMTAAGNEEKVTKGKQTLLWAVLGLIVIFSSYAILKTIFESINFN